MVAEGSTVRCAFAVLAAAFACACGDDASVQTSRAPVYICGNGQVEQGEECDDANRVETDGCTTTCKISKVDIDVTVNSCPKIQVFVVSPSEIPAGYSASAHVQAFDANDDPLAYAWTATSGFFTVPDDPDTEYECDAEGSQILKIVVDDGRHCADEVNLPVSCLPPG